MENLHFHKYLYNNDILKTGYEHLLKNQNRLYPNKHITSQHDQVFKGGPGSDFNANVMAGIWSWSSIWSTVEKFDDLKIETKIGALMLIGLFIYMLPLIIRSIFEILLGTFRTLVRSMVYAIIAGIAINLYMGNTEMLYDMLRLFQKSVNKMLKSLLGSS